MEKQPTPPRPDTLINQNVALVDPTSQNIQYAYAERPKNSNPGTNIIYHELCLWLDTSNRPHRTGNTIDPRQKSITTVEEWDDTPSDPPPVYGSGILEEKSGAKRTPVRRLARAEHGAARGTVGLGGALVGQHRGARAPHKLVDESRA